MGYRPRLADPQPPRVRRRLGVARVNILGLLLVFNTAWVMLVVVLRGHVPMLNVLVVGILLALAHEGGTVRLPVPTLRRKPDPAALTIIEPDPGVVTDDWPEPDYCSCGSVEASLPVIAGEHSDAVREFGQPEVVAYICPECRERRHGAGPEGEHPSMQAIAWHGPDRFATCAEVLRTGADGGLATGDDTDVFSMLPRQTIHMWGDFTACGLAMDPVVSDNSTMEWDEVTCVGCRTSGIKDMRAHVKRETLRLHEDLEEFDACRDGDAINEPLYREFRERQSEIGRMHEVVNRIERALQRPEPAPQVRPGETCARCDCEYVEHEVYHVMSHGSATPTREFVECPDPRF